MSRRFLLLVALLLAAIIVSGCCCCCGGGRRYFSPYTYPTTRDQVTTLPTRYVQPANTTMANATAVPTAMLPHAAPTVTGVS